MTGGRLLVWPQATTTAAAVAARLALDGWRVVVVTPDVACTAACDHGPEVAVMAWAWAKPWSAASRYQRKASRGSGAVPRPVRTMDRVTPAQWWVFSLATDTTRSACPRASGSHSVSPSRLQPPRLAAPWTGPVLRSRNGSLASTSTSAKPEVSSTSRASRRCPAPSATVTEAAPRDRKASAAAPMTRGWVLMCPAPAWGSTRLGLSSTRLPAISRAVRPSSASPRPRMSRRSA